jgi:hypothetical protein
MIYVGYISTVRSSCKIAAAVTGAFFAIALAMALMPGQALASEPEVIVAPTAATLNYTGAAQVAVKAGTGYELKTPSTDASIDSSGNAIATKAGTYTVSAHLTDTSKYVWQGGTNDVTITFSIKTTDIATASISVDDQIYTGSKVEAPVTVIYAGKTLTPGTDYELHYYDNIDVGTAKVTINGMNNFTGSTLKTFEIADCCAMYRLYNPFTGEHLYTADTTERDSLAKTGWNKEGVGWYAPIKSASPVYRLYNPFSGDHHYTLDYNEYTTLGTIGWNQEGIGWYSDDSKTVSLYRQFNPYETIGTHNYTADVNEKDTLISLGWTDEGVAWYAKKAAA